MQGDIHGAVAAAHAAMAGKLAQGA
jgi:hypothetical protein